MMGMTLIRGLIVRKSSAVARESPNGFTPSSWVPCNLRLV